MTPEYQITVKGLPEKQAYDLGNAVAVVVNTLAQADDALDLRRMHRIIITTDFAGELTELSNRTALGNQITYTNEEYAIAGAKVLMLPDGEGFELLPVINAQIVAPLLLALEGSEDSNSEELEEALHFLHHELCHIHDDNKHIDAFRSVMLSKRYEGKDMIIRPLAEACWAEYIANVFSAPTVPKSFMSSMTCCLVDALARTKPLIDKKILSYRKHGDINDLMQIFKRHGEFLVKTAAYVIGYMDGLDQSLQELDPVTAQQMSGSYFEAT